MFISEFKANVNMVISESHFLPLSDCEVTEWSGSDYFETMDDFFTWSMPDSLIEVLDEMGHSQGSFNVSGILQIVWVEDYYGEVDSNVYWENLVIKENV